MSKLITDQAINQSNEWRELSIDRTENPFSPLMIAFILHKNMPANSPLSNEINVLQQDNQLFRG